MDYKEEYERKLRDYRWRAVSYSIKNRDGFICNICTNVGGVLNTHHKVYTTKDPWDEDWSNLITLCEDCHVWTHSYQNETGLNFYYDEWVDKST